MYGVCGGLRWWWWCDVGMVTLVKNRNGSLLVLVLHFERSRGRVALCTGTLVCLCDPQCVRHDGVWLWTGRSKVWYNRVSRTVRLVFLKTACANNTSNHMSLSKPQIVQCVVTDAVCGACLVAYLVFLVFS